MFEAFHLCTLVSATIKVEASCFSSKQVSFPSRFGTTPSDPLSRTKGQSSSKHLVHQVNQVHLKNVIHLAYQTSFCYDARPFHSPSFEPFSTSITCQTLTLSWMSQGHTTTREPDWKNKPEETKWLSENRFFRGPFFSPSRRFTVSTQVQTTPMGPQGCLSNGSSCCPAPSGLQTTDNKRSYLLLRLPRWICSFPLSLHVHCYESKT